METKDNTVWLRNSVDSLVGIISVTASKLEPRGWITVNCSPMSMSVDLTPEQMRALASQLIAAAAEVEQRLQSSAQ